MVENKESKKGKTSSVKKNRYIEAVGRRKTAVARVRLTPAGKLSFIINDKDLDSYFPTKELQKIARESFLRAEKEGDFKYEVSALIKGGGIHAQAEALRLGIARALILENQELRKKLKEAGFLKRDPRSKERRKFGLKKARKSPQWSKR